MTNTDRTKVQVEQTENGGYLAVARSTETGKILGSGEEQDDLMAAEAEAVHLRRELRNGKGNDGMSYYAICNVNGPISVRLSSADEFDANRGREWIDDARTDAEDDLGIDGDGMDEAEFAEAMKRAGYVPIEHPDGNIRDGWVIWSARDPETRGSNDGASEEAPYEKVIGRYEEYGRYLPAALLRLDRERFLDREAFLLRFRNPDGGTGLRMSDRDLLLATEELSEGHFPASIMFPGPIESEDALLGAAWKVLKDALGLLYTDPNGVTWGIGEDWDDNLILVNVTAREKERQNTVEVCESCLGGVSFPHFNDSDTFEFFQGRCEVCGKDARVTYGVLS